MKNKVEPTNSTEVPTPVTFVVKQLELDLWAALKEVERLQRERNWAWEELRQAGLRPPWPRG